MIALRAFIQSPVVAGSSSTQPFAPSRSGGRRVSGGLLSFSRTVLFALVTSATYQTAPQLTSTPLMAGGASRQPPSARRAPRRREGLIGQISGGSAPGGLKILPHPAAEARVPRPPQPGSAARRRLHRRRLPRMLHQHRREGPLLLLHLSRCRTRPRRCKQVFKE